jgi:hypothetical protein
MSRPVRIANFSGFYGDRLSAPRELLAGGPIDFLTGDYLAELTLMILWKARRKDPSAGYATTFLRQMEGVLGEAKDRGVRIVTDAGGLNPSGLAEQLHALAQRLGIDVKIAFIEGDDLMGKDLGLPFEPITANAYLGSWGVVEALDRGADVVVAPRITDAVLTVAPAAHWHGWARTDWDRLAAAVVAGHVIECGAQATGGNYPFLQELGDMRAPGFPIAEIAGDGTTVITKHPGTGGAVTVGTVTAQLLYEIGGPRYLNPDVVARFDTIELTQDEPDRVRIDGVRGEPSPPQTKVCVNYQGGYRNAMTFVLAGLDVEAKARMVEEALRAKLRPQTLEFQLVDSGEDDPSTNERAFSYLRVIAKDPDPKQVGRRFSSACIELALSTYAGCFATTPPQSETEYTVYWPAFVDAELVEEVVTSWDGERVTIAQTRGGDGEPVEVAARAFGAREGPTQRLPLGLVAGARSGDKGGDANCGVWARTDAGYGWLREYLTVERLRALLPEARALEIDRHQFPNLRALNFVLKGFLGEGVMSNTSMDPQAKSLGEYLRAKVVDIPVALIHEGDNP